MTDNNKNDARPPKITKRNLSNKVADKAVDKVAITSRLKTVKNASIAVLPLSIAVIPWGILCGTLSIEAGLSGVQAQLMSLAVFAGASQLAGIAIFGTVSSTLSGGASWLALLNSTSMIGVRHVLYSASYQAHVRHLPLVKRLLFAFLLTDEMFVVAQAEQLKTGRFDYWYAVAAGFIFYVTWNLSTFVGIYTAHLLGNIEEMGFDFAIAAIFIAMVVPMLFKKEKLFKNKRLFKTEKLFKNEKLESIESIEIEEEQEKTTTKKSLDLPMLIAVLVSALSAFGCAYFGINQGLIIATLIGMATGAVLVVYNNSISNNDNNADNYVDKDANKNNDNDINKDDTKKTII